MKITDELLNHLTRPQTKTLWGQPITSYDYLIKDIHGNGEQLVYLQTMNSRPFHYIIRVDSSLDLEKEYYEILPKDSEYYFDEMLMQMIEEECDNIDSYEEISGGLYTCDQDIDEGIKAFEYKWPMFSLGAGHSYGVVDIDYHLRMMKKHSNPSQP